MKASLVISYYKDICALKLILSSLSNQSYSNFEVIIAEDDNSLETKAVIIEYSSRLTIKHHFQEDDGIRKSLAQNSAAKLAEGDIIIFIDGDCIPYPNFIESHVKLSKKGHALSGKRLNLGPKYSAQLRGGKTIKQFFSSFPFNIIGIALDCKEGHLEAGLNLNHRIFKWIIPMKDTRLLGCNFSCHRHDFEAINGFDEIYLDTAIADDTDIEWRFRAYGLNISSVKFYANVVHLYHEKRSKVIPYLHDMQQLMQQRKSLGQYRASIGLTKG